MTVFFFSFFFSCTCAGQVFYAHCMNILKPLSFLMLSVQYIDHAITYFWEVLVYSCKPLRYSARPLGSSHTFSQTDSIGVISIPTLTH